LFYNLGEFLLFFPLLLARGCFGSKPQSSLGNMVAKNHGIHLKCKVLPHAAGLLLTHGEAEWKGWESYCIDPPVN